MNIFLDDLIIRGMQDFTLKAYKSHIMPFIKFTENILVCNINYEIYCDYVRYLRKKRLSPVTIHTYINSLKVFLRFLHKNFYLKENLAEKIILPRSYKTEPNILSPDLILKIINDYDTNDFIECRNILILILAFDCGLRRSEIVRLKFDDLMLDSQIIKISGKGNKNRIIPISYFLEIYLKKYLNLVDRKSGFLIINKDGLVLSPSAISSLFRRLRKKYGLSKFNPHLLRHSYATLFLINGGDSLALQRLLGHSTLAMTNKYIHLAQSLKIAEQKKFSPLNKNDLD